MAWTARIGRQTHHAGHFVGVAQSRTQFVYGVRRFPCAGFVDPDKRILVTLIKVRVLVPIEPTHFEGRSAWKRPRFGPRAPICP